MVGHIREASSEQRLHDDGGNTAFDEFVVEIFGICVARLRVYFVFPVEIVELYLNEIPFIFVVVGKQAVEHVDVAVE